ncbi:LysR family transcriptional regulator [Xanthobacter dioxanivorans]|uniref:LysR substrate-binding domain-containing protein n=1 Tax=Xanthobacter dioxanivorans TaxID=2528964 RepID=UPI001E6245D6|nr:LysR family transcriptional regulator [Xanthobacter dioxanivorans]
MKPKSKLQSEIRHLRTFVAAAEFGSFRKAANGLHVQESAVSRRIRDLEDQIGASLFIRHAGGIALTLAGQRFLTRARLALGQLDEGLREVSAIGRSETGHLRVGLFSSIASGFVSRLFGLYDDRYPSVEVDFIEGSAECHMFLLNKLQMDIAFTIGNRKQHPYDAHELWREQVFAAVWDEHPLGAKSELSWSDLALEEFLVRPGGPGDEVRDYLSLRLSQIGRQPRFRVQNIGRYSLLGLVASRRGVAPMLASETAISIPGVIYRPIAGEILPFFAITSPKNDNPAARTLLSLARILSRSENSRP